MSHEDDIPNGRVRGRIYYFVVALVVCTLVNLAGIVIICVFVMPRVDRSIEETAKNRAAIEANRESIENNQRFLKEKVEENQRHWQRLNDMIDAQIARQKAIEAKMKAKEKKEEEKK